MDRETFRLPKIHLKEVEQLVEDGEYPSRSEAYRAFIREGLKGHRKRRYGDETRPLTANDRPWADAPGRL